MSKSEFVTYDDVITKMSEDAEEFGPRDTLLNWQEYIDKVVESGGQIENYNQVFLAIEEFKKLYTLH